MSFASTPTLLRASRSQYRLLIRPQSRRTFFSIFKSSKPKPKSTPEPVPVLSQDDLFHPFSKSPFPAVRARGEAIQKLAPCPVCALSHPGHHRDHFESELEAAHTRSQPKAVKYECPDCGWPTHCSEEHWQEDEEHQKYCSRLREVNEDEHDLRSGRRMREFELPGTSSHTSYCPLKFRIMNHYIQVPRIQRQPSRLRIGMSFGTLVVSHPWTLRGQEGMQANCLLIL